jgi:hypothetical protein
LLGGFVKRILCLRAAFTRALMAPRCLMVRGLDYWIVRVRHDPSATLLRGGTRIILYFGAIGPGTIGNGPVSPS